MKFKYKNIICLFIIMFIMFIGKVSAKRNYCLYENGNVKLSVKRNFDQTGIIVNSVGEMKWDNHIYTKDFNQLVKEDFFRDECPNIYACKTMRQYSTDIISNRWFFYSNSASTKTDCQKINEIKGNIVSIPSCIYQHKFTNSNDVCTVIVEPDGNNNVVIESSYYYVNGEFLTCPPVTWNESIYQGDRKPFSYTEVANDPEKLTKSPADITVPGNPLLDDPEEDPDNIGTGIGEGSTGCGIFGPRTLEIMKWVVGVIRFGVPILIILLGVRDFIMIIVSGAQTEDKSYKTAWNNLIKRLLIGVAFLLIPYLIKFLFNLGGIMGIYGIDEGDVFCGLI